MRVSQVFWIVSGAMVVVVGLRAANDTVRLKADTTYSTTVRLKADTTYSTTVRPKADTTYQQYVVSGFSRTFTSSAFNQAVAQASVDRSASIGTA